MAKIRILVVEDDEKTIADWHKKIEIHNADTKRNKFAIHPTMAKSVNEALELLEDRYFDAAVIDLRLGGQGKAGHNDQGNAVVQHLAGMETAATAIYTGQPGEADIPASAPHIRIFEKGEGLDPVLAWLIEQSAIMLQIQKVRNTIRRDMAAIFHRSIWPRWQNWMKDGSGDALQAAVTRHFVSHLQASLLSSTAGKAHSEEWYFVPPLRNSRLATGDMFRNQDGSVEILVTPRCDLVRDEKIQTYQLAICEDVRLQWEELHKKARDGNKSAQNELSSAWPQHKRNTSLHFLPQMIMTEGEIRGPWFVRFDKIQTLANTSMIAEELRGKRFAAVTSDFLPTLVERLGGYFSRIGSPDLS